MYGIHYRHLASKESTASTEITADTDEMMAAASSSGDVSIDLLKIRDDSCCLVSVGVRLLLEAKSKKMQNE